MAENTMANCGDKPHLELAFGLLWRLKEKKLGRREVGFPHQELGILNVIKI